MIGGYACEMAIHYVKSRDLLEAEVGEDIVALDADAGLCFGFNSVAADIWRLLDKPRDFESLLELLAGQYDVALDECAAGLKSCLADLEAKGLILTKNQE